MANNATDTLKELLNTGKDGARIAAARIVYEHVDRKSERRMRALVHLAWLVLAAFFVFSHCGCHFYTKQPAAPRPVDQQTGLAVSVETFCVDKDVFSSDVFSARGGYGSGVIVDARHVLTANHVTDCPYERGVQVTTLDGRRFRMVVEKEWPDLDIARLEIATAEKFGDIHPPTIAKPLAVQRDKMCSAPSFPYRGTSCGEFVRQWPVPQCHPTKSGGRYCFDIELAMIVMPGNSGGGLYNEAGELVGLVTAGNGLGGEGGATSLWLHASHVMP